MTRHPIDEQLLQVIQHLQIRTIPPLEAEVLSQAADGSLEVRLLAEDDVKAIWGLEAGMQGVPLALQGCWAAKIAPGAKVVVEFLDSDVRKPIVRTLLSATFVELETKAITIKIGDAASSITLAGSSQPVVRVGDVLAVGLVANLVSGAVTGAIAVTPPISRVTA